MESYDVLYIKTIEELPHGIMVTAENGPSKATFRITEAYKQRVYIGMPVKGHYKIGELN